MFFRKKKEDTKDTKGIVMHIQFGGYYASKKNNEFSIIRLLDFGRSAYHIQLFQEKFDHLPAFDEVKELWPFVWHIPISLSGLLDSEQYELIGHKKLDEQSLVGYEEYLKQMGVNEASIKERVDDLIDYSNEPPLKVRLTESADGFTLFPLE
jgi:hypothetical protein